MKKKLGKSSDSYKTKKIVDNLPVFSFLQFLLLQSR